jgi:hypothetical protein
MNRPLDAGGGHAQWAGIVFTPLESADASVAELDTRHIDHGPPIPNPSKPRAEEPEQTLWTTVRVRDLGVPGSASSSATIISIRARDSRRLPRS